MSEYFWNSVRRISHKTPLIWYILHVHIYICMYCIYIYALEYVIHVYDMVVVFIKCYYILYTLYLHHFWREIHHASWPLDSPSFLKAPNIHASLASSNNCQHFWKGTEKKTPWKLAEKPENPQKDVSHLPTPLEFFGPTVGSFQEG